MVNNTCKVFRLDFEPNGAQKLIVCVYQEPAVLLGRNAKCRISPAQCRRSTPPAPSREVFDLTSPPRLAGLIIHFNTRTGGGHIMPTTCFSRISQKRRRKFRVPAYKSRIHHVCKFWLPRSKGQVIRFICLLSKNIHGHCKYPSYRCSHKTGQTQLCTPGPASNMEIVLWAQFK